MTEYLNISQVNKDASAADDICLLEVPNGTYNRITRMPFQFRKDDSPLVAWDVMIDLMDEHLDLIGDAPLVIPPHSGAWLLETFFKVQAKFVRKIKNTNRDFRQA